MDESLGNRLGKTNTNNRLKQEAGEKIDFLFLGMQRNPQNLTNDKNWTKKRKNQLTEAVAF